jgi:hypothetical protein
MGLSAGSLYVLSFRICGYWRLNPATCERKSLQQMCGLGPVSIGNGSACGIGFHPVKNERGSLRETGRFGLFPARNGRPGLYYAGSL